MPILILGVEASPLRCIKSLRFNCGRCLPKQQAFAHDPKMAIPYSGVYVREGLSGGETVPI